MKHLTKTLLIFLLLSLSAGSCKKDDDNPNNNSDNFSEYFTCKINGVEFTTRSDFNCNGKSFYYYPAGTGGLDNGYMLISGENCHENLTVALRIYNPDVPAIGTFSFLTPEFADSSSPAIRHNISGDGVYIYENLIGGELSVASFTSRDSTTMEFGKLEGTFEFTVRNEEIDSTVVITEGRFQYIIDYVWY